MPNLRLACPLAALLLLAACGGRNPDRFEVRAMMAEGNFKLAYGHGYAPADEAAILRITARLERSAGRLVFTLADGSQRTLTFAPRPPSQWKPDCFTMNSHILCEVADLAPGNLRLESMNFSSPLAFAKCDPNRIILANTTLDDGFDLVFIHD